MSSKDIKQDAASFLSRLRQTARLLKILFLEFRTFIICSSAAFFLSAYLLFKIYPIQELPSHHHTFLGVAYDTLQMTFFQTPIPFVDDWRLIPVFFGLPLLGLLVIAEGVVQLGHLLVYRRNYSREWQNMLAATYENHIVVAGLGNVGFRVIEHLKRCGENVICIERNSECSFLPELEKYEVPSVIGDVKNAQTLEKASIKKAKAFLAVTTDDLANLEAALTARELAPQVRIVIRVFDQRLAQKVEKSFGINSAFSASALSAPVFAQAALSSNILASFEFAGTVVNAFQLTIDSKCPLSLMSIDKVRHDYEVTVMMHERKNLIDWNPPPNTVLQEGDKVLIMADNKNIQTFISSTVSG
ncbi:MAG: TrkA family potassium uptake protein [Candidatus Obscuribacterales bacterium]|nr:TrkA family potassium uptake protein [Candidatus Obscuribacterales bacterium]